jgi:ribosome-binding factor A
MTGVSVTVTEVRMSPDLRHALAFVEPLGGGHASEVVAALNRAARFLRGRLGRHVELKFTPDLKFVHDESFTEAARMNRLFASDAVRRDLGGDDEPDQA